MGKNNSSKMRVCPLMQQIVGNKEAYEKVFSEIKDVAPFSNNLKYFYDDEQNGIKEKGLKPSKRHLSALITYMATKEHISKEDYTKRLGHNLNPNREKLFYDEESDRRAKTSQEALCKLEDKYDTLPPKSRLWYIFEGYTYPDVFIEGDDFIIVCEGKWTEPDITEKTTNLFEKDEFRNQMVRHIQAAQNYDPQKKVYAYYLVPEKPAYEEKIKYENFQNILDKETIKIPQDERKKLKESYKGFITWEEIEETLQIKF